MGESWIIMENYVDFHIHSTFSDGKYSIGEITNFARKHNFRSIGITDHYKTTKVKSMDNKMLEKYIETIDSINSDIKIYKGIEIDFSSRTDFSMLDFSIFENLNFVLFEYVEDSSMGGYPLWRLLEIFDKIKIPIGLAHNNIMKNFHFIKMDDLISLFESHSIFIELNTNKNYTILGEYYYTLSEEFFKLLKGRNVPISVGSDMHNSLDEMLNVKNGLEFIELFNLNDNLDLFLKNLK